MPLKFSAVILYPSVSRKLRSDNEQPLLSKSVLQPKLFQMSGELAKIDMILDDERFFAPFRQKSCSGVGRPTIPASTYLKMMFLKRLCKEEGNGSRTKGSHQELPNILAVV